MKRYNYSVPLLLAALVAFGMFLGVRCHTSYQLTSKNNPYGKLEEVLQDIENSYVDKPDKKKLTDAAITGLLQDLDPHSVYIPAEDLKVANEDLEGNFEGVGIEFNILNDTIMVVSAISGGPSAALGIHAGDRIVKINDKVVAGVGFTNEDVFKSLRGTRGSTVKVSIQRAGESRLMDFNIKRDRIPIYSVDASYIAAPGIGYIKVNRFAANTMDEYNKAFGKLRSEGMKSLILDLRGNPGGYLKASFQMADEFLSKDKLVVYTRGEHRPIEKYTASDAGSFEEGKLVVLIDEGSASASEIVSGALQDQDRALIIGRRSFGKGLVQEPFALSDGSAIRLTVARYYTPSGRSIQRSYGKNTEDYYEDIARRFKHGEMLSQDSIHFNDSLKYKTLVAKRTVYGGGGIMPDIFVPIDTAEESGYLQKLLTKGLFNTFVADYTDRHRAFLTSTYKDFATYNKSFEINPAIMNEFLNQAERRSIGRDEKGEAVSAPYIRIQLKALFARQLFQNEGYFRVVNDNNKAFKKAISALQDNTMDRMQISYK